MKSFRATASCLMIAAFLAGAAGAQLPSHVVEPLEFRAGEHGAWSGQRIREPGPWEMRTTIRLEEAAPEGTDLALRVYAGAAFEVRWDGELLGSNGRIGSTRAEETPGAHFAWVALPTRLATAGEHRVEIQASSWYVGKIRGPLHVQLHDRGRTERQERLRTALFLGCAGILFIVAILSAAFRNSLRIQIDGLLFALLVASTGAMLVAEHWKYLHDYAYSWHLQRLVIISALTGTVSVLLPAFTIAHLRLAGLRVLPPLLVVGFFALGLVSDDPDAHSLLMLRSSIVLSLGMSVYGWVRRRPGAGWTSLALAVNLPAMLLTGFRFADHWFFVGFLAMVALLLVRMLRAVSELARERANAIRILEQTRHELMRRTIQPHFLMNILSAAMGTIEENPVRGRTILSDLAAQLSAFFAIGEKDWIPVRDELDLCRRHVRSMAHLLELPLELQVEPDAVPAEMPPGVVLTLVENAIKHGRMRQEPKIVVLIEITGGQLAISVTNSAMDSDQPTADGAGLRFVRAQLARRDVGGFLATERIDGRWRSRIEMPLRPQPNNSRRDA